MPSLGSQPPKLCTCGAGYLGDFIRKIPDAQAAGLPWEVHDQFTVLKSLILPARGAPSTQYHRVSAPTRPRVSVGPLGEQGHFSPRESES